jgi:hypothetical protein
VCRQPHMPLQLPESAYQNNNIISSYSKLIRDLGQQNEDENVTCK